MNLVQMTGIVQGGKDGKSGIYRNATQTSEVLSFSVISKYGENDKYSSGYIGIQMWNNGDGLPVIQPGDYISIEGSIKSVPFTKKDGTKGYNTVVCATKIGKKNTSPDEDRYDLSSNTVSTVDNKGAIPSHRDSTDEVKESSINTVTTVSETDCDPRCPF